MAQGTTYSIVYGHLNKKKEEKTRRNRIDETTFILKYEWRWKRPAGLFAHHIFPLVMWHCLLFSSFFFADTNCRQLFESISVQCVALQAHQIIGQSMFYQFITLLMTEILSYKNLYIFHFSFVLNRNDSAFILSPSAVRRGVVQGK